MNNGLEDRLVYTKGNGDGQGGAECNARLEPLSLIQILNHFSFQKSSISTPRPSATRFT